MSTARDDAERLRTDDAHWTLGVIYRCSADPRVIVRNRFRFGWTWNFGHRSVWWVLPAYIAAFFAPVLLTRPPIHASPLMAMVACFAVFLLLVYIANWIAEGPR